MSAPHISSPTSFLPLAMLQFLLRPTKTSKEGMIQSNTISHDEEHLQNKEKMCISKQENHIKIHINGCWREEHAYLLRYIHPDYLGTWLTAKNIDVRYVHVWAFWVHFWPPSSAKHTEFWWHSSGTYCIVIVLCTHATVPEQESKRSRLTFFKHGIE